MTYLKFTLWLLALYFIYYTALILWDMLRAKGPGAQSADHELTFAEPFAPLRPAFESAADDISSSVVATGGVSLRQLFNLAQEEAIEYTSQVSF